MSPQLPNDPPAELPPFDMEEPRWDDLPGWPQSPSAYQTAPEESAADQLESLLIEQQQARVLRNVALGP
jgi:hypothetical protein